MSDKDKKLRELAAQVQATCTEGDELTSFLLELIPRFGLGTFVDCTAEAVYHHHAPLGDAISSAVQEAREEEPL